MCRNLQEQSFLRLSGRHTECARYFLKAIAPNATYQLASRRCWFLGRGLFFAFGMFTQNAI